MRLFFVLLCTVFLSAQQMKCQSGKCSGSKSITTKEQTLSKMAYDVKIKQLFNVRTIEVKKRKLHKELKLYGFVALDDSLSVAVTPYFSGYIEKLYVKNRYERVKRGQVLAKIYSSQVYKAKLEYINALNFNSKHPSPAMLKGAKERLLLMGVLPSEIVNITKTRRASRLTDIHALRSGIVMQNSALEGGYVDGKKSLFVISSLKRVWVEGEILQRYIGDLGSFENFVVKAKGTDKTFKTKRYLLYPKMKNKSATATLRLYIENPKEDLVDGMYVDIFAKGRAKKLLSLPKSAIIRKKGRWFVFLATKYEGIYKPKEVMLRYAGDDMYEVLDGLKEGDRVVDKALFLIDADAQLDGIF